MPILAYILVALAAYLLGSIPTGYLVAKAKGIDIRSVGSGNIGATNAMRVLGKPAGIFVLLVDALKGYVACAFLPAPIYNWLSPHFFGLAPQFHAEPVELQIRFNVIAGIFVILGHNYTCWLRFKGGKGIATTAGAYFALAPLSAGIALGVWILLLVATRYVSIASILAAAALPIAVWCTKDSALLGIVTTLLGSLAIYKHKSNIQRLMAGTENRVNFKKEKTAT